MTVSVVMTCRKRHEFETWVLAVREESEVIKAALC
jgi:hypothetical protein